jgi:Uma2 family endonuclease
MIPRHLFFESVMTRAITQVGPSDNGKRMSLAEFDRAEGREGYNYELSRGVITVVDVPDRKHLLQVCAVREQFSAYWRAHPGKINLLAHGGECKILLADLESERHPDLAVYKHEPVDDENLWATWVPEVVVEVVSSSSRQRDYVEKRKEYLDFGIREYWIIDEEKQEMLVLRRSGGRWIERIVRPGDKYRTRWLSEFEFDLAAVFDAARCA